MSNNLGAGINEADCCRLRPEYAHCRMTGESEPKTALYCRTAVRDDFAIKNQLERVLDFALENGHTNLAVYIDNGESGATLARPAMNRLINDIVDGAVHTVIVMRTDRIARGIEHMWEWLQLIEESNVSCFSIDCGESEIRSMFRFWDGIMAMIQPTAPDRTNHAWKAGS